MSEYLQQYPHSTTKILIKSLLRIALINQKLSNVLRLITITYHSNTQKETKRTIKTKKNTNFIVTRHSIFTVKAGELTHKTLRTVIYQTVWRERA